MGVVIDVILAVTVIAIAFGAVAEFQLRIGHIRSSADGALVIVRGLLLSTGVGRCPGKGDGTGLLFGLFGHLSTELDPPGHWDHIENILAEKQQVVGNGQQGKEIDREGDPRCGKADHINEGKSQIKESKDPGPDRDDEEQ